MSSAPPPDAPNNGNNKPDTAASSSTPANAGQDAAMDTTPDKPAEETWDDIPEEIMNLSTDEIFTRIRLIDNDLKVCRVSGSAQSEAEYVADCRSCARRPSVSNMNKVS